MVGSYFLFEVQTVYISDCHEVLHVNLLQNVSWDTQSKLLGPRGKKKVLGGLFWESWNFSPQVNFNLSTKLNICAGDINDIRFNREIISYSICKKEWDFVLAFDGWGAWLLSMGGEEGDGAEGRRTWGSVGCGCRIDVDNGRRWNRKLCFRW